MVRLLLFSSRLLLDEEGASAEDAVILTDILGVEDALGTMDFKVAGNKDGELLVDIKNVQYRGSALRYFWFATLLHLYTKYYFAANEALLTVCF